MLHHGIELLMENILSVKMLRKILSLDLSILTETEPQHSEMKMNSSEQCLNLVLNNLSFSHFSIYSLHTKTPHEHDSCDFLVFRLYFSWFLYILSGTTLHIFFSFLLFTPICQRSHHEYAVCRISSENTRDILLFLRRLHATNFVPMALLVSPLLSSR